MAEASDRKLQSKVGDLEKKVTSLSQRLGKLEEQVKELKPAGRPAAYDPAPPVVQTRNRPKY
jgi:chaperonin cofactor prefoldin